MSHISDVLNKSCVPNLTQKEHIKPSSVQSLEQTIQQSLNSYQRSFNKSMRTISSVPSMIQAMSKGNHVDNHVVNQDIDSKPRTGIQTTESKLTKLDTPTKTKPVNVYSSGQSSKHPLEDSLDFIDSPKIDDFYFVEKNMTASYSSPSLITSMMGDATPLLPEPMLDTTVERPTLFPIQYPDLFAFYKKQLASDWNVEEVDTSRDAADFKKLNPDEQHFIKNILGFFAASDEIVNENLAKRFLSEVTCHEALRNYRFQAMMEDKHSEMYVTLIDTIISDDLEKNRLYNAVNELPCVRKKALWAKHWIEGKESHASFARRLIAFSIVEGLFFSGAFCAVYWLRQRNVMPGLCKSNEFIARDEGMHTTFATMMYGHTANKVPETDVHGMIEDAVAIEDEYINKSLPCRLLGMNSQLMSQYIRFVADRLLADLGYSPIYGIQKCPFDFMEQLSLEGKTNFFEHRPTEYARATVNNASTNSTFEEMDDF